MFMASFSLPQHIGDCLSPSQNSQVWFTDHYKQRHLLPPSHCHLRILRLSSEPQQSLSRKAFSATRASTGTKKPRYHSFDAICAKTITLQSGKRRNPKPKLFGLDILGWGGGLPTRRGGGQKFRMWLENQENRILGGISRGCPKSLTKKVCVQFLSPIQHLIFGQQFFWAP